MVERDSNNTLLPRDKQRPYTRSSGKNAGQPIELVSPKLRRHLVEMGKACRTSVTLFAKVEHIVAGQVQETTTEVGELEIRRFNGGDHGLYGKAELRLTMPDGSRFTFTNGSVCLMLDDGRMG
jgi:hypothetical protein